MTNEQIEAYINGKGVEELLARQVWVAHLQWPQENGFVDSDGTIREPKIKVTRECVQEVLTGYINNCFCVEVDNPPRRKERIYWIRVMNDERHLYYPWEVYLTESEARSVARKKISKMTSEFRERLIEEVKKLKERVDYTKNRIKLLEKWIGENREGETK